MSGGRVKVGVFVHLYTWIFVLAVGLWPLLAPSLLARHNAVSIGVWARAAVLIGLLQLVFWYTQRRCSSEALSFVQESHDPVSL